MTFTLPILNAHELCCIVELYQPSTHHIHSAYPHRCWCHFSHCDMLQRFNNMCCVCVKDVGSTLQHSCCAVVGCKAMYDSVTSVPALCNDSQAWSWSKQAVLQQFIADV